MTLRAKTLLAICSTLLGLCIVLYAVASTLLLDSVDRAEEGHTRGLLENVMTLIEQRRQQLASRYADWSAWDDAYEFVADGNERFKEANLVEPTLANLKLDAIAFVDTSGRLMYGSGFDQEKRIKTPLPEGLSAHIAPGSRLLARSEADPHITGFVMLPAGAMLVTAQAILTSTKDTPRRFFSRRFIAAAIATR